MAKKGYIAKTVRSKRSVYCMNQVFERNHDAKKLSVFQIVNLCGIVLVLLAPVAFILLFFAALLVG